MCPMEGNLIRCSCARRCFNISFNFLAEVVRAMNYVIEKGWVMYWGRSFGRGMKTMPCHVTSQFQGAQNGRRLKSWKLTQIVVSLIASRKF